MGGARPEGADVPQDADGAAGGRVPVGAAAPGDEEEEAEPYEPGPGVLRGAGGALQQRVGAPGGLARDLPAEPGSGERARAEQQGDPGDGAREPGRGVGQRGGGPGPGDLPAARAVRRLAGVLGGDGRGEPAPLSGPADGEPGGEQGQYEEQRGAVRRPARTAARAARAAGRRPSRGGPAVEPVGHAPRDPAGHHPAERAAQHGDGRPAEAAQGGVRVGRRAVEAAGDDGQGQYAAALGQHERAEGEVTREPPGGLPAGPRPAGVAEDGDEQGEGAAGQQG
ncbi:hypothetical protein GCM10020254_71070 [Streptomyces goshikiensis]